MAEKLNEVKKEKTNFKKQATKNNRQNKLLQKKSIQQQTQITAEKEERPIRDGEILTACQQVCPTQAIVFGDLNDPNSRVAKLQASKRNYGLLDDLNTRPRTTYLAYVRNSNETLRGQRGNHREG